MCTHTPALYMYLCAHRWHWVRFCLPVSQDQFSLCNALWLIIVCSYMCTSSTCTHTHIIHAPVHELSIFPPVHELSIYPPVHVLSIYPLVHVLSIYPPLHWQVVKESYSIPFILQLLNSPTMYKDHLYTMGVCVYSWSRKLKLYNYMMQ